MFQTLRYMIEWWFGVYTPVMTTASYQLADGTIHEYQVVADGVASWDIPYILGFIMTMIFYIVILRYINIAITIVSGKRIKLI